MAGYVFKRFIYMILTIWIVATITFFLMHAIPGNPFVTGARITPEVLANLEAKYGLDKPLVVQYFRYMGNLLKGDLGLSLQYRNRPITKMLAAGFPASAQLVFPAMFLGSSVGLFFGIIAALNNKGFADYFVIFLAVLGISVPIFVFASLFQYFFAVHIRWFPVAGWKTTRHMVLPIIALAFRYIAYNARMMKTSMIEIMGSDYVVTAKAKGLSKPVVIMKHVVRNASIPIVTYLGPMLTTAVLGTFVIERIYGVPGVGKYMIQAIQQRDYTMILAMTLSSAALVILGVFVSDLLYGVVDPRIRVGK